MNDDSLKELLEEEIQHKKPQAAYFDCDGCGGTIAEGETFFFFGEAKKVCEECRDNMFGLLY